MDIGIGITSYKRPEMLEKCLEHIHKFSGDHKLYVAIDKDEDRQGVAKRKNECLRALQNCDYIFLFDDDCYPIKKGWEDFFINSGENHLLYLKHSLHTPIDKKNNIIYYNDCGGVFLFVTKDTLNKVGAFNEDFDIYGFEHAEWSIRILGQHGRYPMLNGTEKYIYSEDYSNPNHTSSITNFEKSFYFNKNFNTFAKPITTIYRPL